MPKNSKTRVLFICPVPPPTTGQSVACEVLLNALIASTKYEVDVVDLSKRGFAQGLDSFSRVLEVAAILLRVFILQFRADVIYFTIAESRAGNLKDLLIYMCCFFKLHRMIIHLHGGAGIRTLFEYGASTRRINFFFFRRISKIVVLGPRLLSIFLPGVAQGKVRVVPNFASGELFLNEVQVREKFLETEPLRVLFLSNLLPGKGHTELAAALKLMKPTARASIRVDFAGLFEDVVQEQAFRESIHDIPQISYHGAAYGQAKAEFFRKAHVFCLPTYYPFEGQPISILEAYASGCAVVTTDHSGIFDVFQHKINGFAVEKKSPESIRDALEWALNNRSELERMALNNRRKALEEYTVERFVNALIPQIEGAQMASHGK